MKTENNEEFQIAHGAPFFNLLCRIGLVNDQELNAGRRSILFVFLAAVVPVGLAFLTSGYQGGVAILTSFEFLARFVLFIVICFYMEKLLEVGLKEYLKQFDHAELLDQVQLKIGAASVARALALRNLAVAEAICLAIAASL